MPIPSFPLVEKLPHVFLENKSKSKLFKLNVLIPFKLRFEIFAKF